MDTNNNEDLNNDHGFIRKPYARKKVIRTPSGQMQVIYEDVRTGKQVNPQGYTVIQSDNNVVNTNVTTTPGQTVNKPNSQQTEDKTAAEQILQSHGKDSVTTTANDPAGANYYNKPGWMGFTSYIPGPLGLVGKAVNLGVNANNTEAVNEQRQALGFAPNSTAKNIGSLISDQNGYIGDVSTTKTDGSVSTAPVSFEAVDKNQRTALTPNEARMREQLAGAKPATDEEKAAAIGSFNNQFPEQNKSFFGGLVSSAKGLFSGIFGGSTPSVNSTTGSGSVGNSSTNTSSSPTVNNNNTGSTSHVNDDGSSVGTGQVGGTTSTPDNDRDHQI